VNTIFSFRGSKTAAIRCICNFELTYLRSSGVLIALEVAFPEGTSSVRDLGISNCHLIDFAMSHEAWR
jgi:hypothetical protein